MTNPPSVPSLDVEACVRLLTKIADALAESARHLKAEMEDELSASVEGYRDDLAKEFAEDDGDAKLARALASALPGMGNDSERYRFLRDNPLQLRAIDGNANAYRTNPTAFDELVDAARAAQPQETSADG